MRENLEIENSGPEISVDDLRRLEATMGRPLPEPYRAFLLAHNGGRPTPDMVDIEGAPFKGSDIHTFLGFSPDAECNDLYWSLETYEGCRESQLLPIAYDSFAEIFVLALTEASYGQVYYFDSAESPPRPYLVAKDFNEFLSKLRAPSPEELEAGAEAAGSS